MREFNTCLLSMFYLPVRTHFEVPVEDEVCIKDIPDGNSKFGAAEIHSVKESEHGVMMFGFFLGGLEKCDYVVTTPPLVGGLMKNHAVWG